VRSTTRQFTTCADASTANGDTTTAMTSLKSTTMTRVFRILLPSMLLLSAVHGAANETAESSDPMHMHVIVGLKDGIKSLREAGMRVKHRYKYLAAETLTVNTDEMAQLLSNPHVAYVERDPLLSLYSTNADMSGNAGSAIQNSSVIPAPLPDEPCLRVCVIDSGFLVEHDALKHLDIEGEEFGLGAGEFWYNPTSPHGTHLTGIIAAQGGNGKGVEANNGVCLRIARAFDDSDSEQSASNVDQAIEWCADQGAKVINLSFGSNEKVRTTEALIDKLSSQMDILFVGAAGNDGSSAYSYPASYDSVVSVASFDRQGKRSRFSQYNDRVDVGAPGEEIVSTSSESKAENKTVTVSLEDESFEAQMLQDSPQWLGVLKANSTDCGIALAECVDCAGKIALVERSTSIALAHQALNAQKGGCIAMIVSDPVDKVGNVVGRLDNRQVVIPAVSIPSQSLATIKKAKDSIVFLKKKHTGTYSAMSGTSTAAAHVSGVAAQIWRARPGCSHTQIQEAMKVTAMRTVADDESRVGIVSAEQAYQYLMTLPTPCGMGLSNSPSLSPSTLPSLLRSSSPSRDRSNTPSIGPSVRPSTLPHQHTLLQDRPYQLVPRRRIHLLRLVIPRPRSLLNDRLRLWLASRRQLRLLNIHQKALPKQQ
jgi:serine protease